MNLFFRILRFIIGAWVFIVVTQVVFEEISNIDDVWVNIGTLIGALIGYFLVWRFIISPVFKKKVENKI